VTRPLVSLATLAVAFAVYSQAVSLDLSAASDREVAESLVPLWQEALRPVAIGLALLGGLELTTLIAVGLAVYLIRGGFRAEAWALLTLPLALLVEVFYKRFVQHPGPFKFAHGDGPSLTMLLERGPNAIPNTYPSGHTLRAVLVYGLLAFVIYRLAPPGRRKRLAAPFAAVIIAIVAFDRLYLGVHWTSDVVGGLLLGGLALAAAVVWLERPGPTGVR
jgi:membrane-associated phospholipid phosphatase